MVTVVGQKDIGGAIGNAIGAAGKGLMPMLEQNYNRGLLQKGLDEAYNNLAPGEQERMKPIFGMLKANAGIPGSDRTLSALLPAMMNRANIQGVYGSADGQAAYGSQPGVGAQNGPASGGMSQQQNMQAQQQQAQQIEAQRQAPQGFQGQRNNMQQPQGMSQGYSQPQNLDDRAAGIADVGLMRNELESGQERPQMQGGLFPRIKSPDEIDAEANRIVMASNGTISKNEALQNQLILNQESKKNRAEAREMAVLNGVPKEDVSKFMEIGEKYADAKNLDTWFNKTKPAFQEYQTAIKSIENSYVPGFYNPEARPSALKNLGVNMRILDKIGQGVYAQQVAAKLGVTPLESSEQMRKLTPELRASIDKLEKGNFNQAEQEKWMRTPEDKRDKMFSPDYNDWMMRYPEGIQRSNKVLGNWIKSNLKPTDSLLVIRDNLIKKKDYDWHQFADALDIAMQGPDGINLSAFQMGELSEYLTEAPRDSLEASLSQPIKNLGNRKKGIR